MSEFLVVGVVPTVVAVAVVALSVHSVRLAPSVLQGSLLFLALLLIVPSSWILIRMFMVDAWPTALPHVVIALTALLTLVQWRLAVRNSRNV